MASSGRTTSSPTPRPRRSSPRACTAKSSMRPWCAAASTSDARLSRDDTTGLQRPVCFWCLTLGAAASADGLAGVAVDVAEFTRGAKQPGAPGFFQRLGLLLLRVEFAAPELGHV